ncbi:MAG: hypothetical protein QNI95_09010 [Desulfobacterales bacterium]|nr:hypothetical protein [Desulfobacterales bacterium]
MQLLIKACRKYRTTIPSYIASRKWEVDLVDSVIEKLNTQMN